MVGACGATIRARCGDVAPGGNRVHDCLLGHLVRGAGRVPAACAAYLRGVAPGVDAAAAFWAEMCATTCHVW